MPQDLLSLRGGRVHAEGEQLSLTIADLAAQASWQNRRLHAEGFYAMAYPEPHPDDGYPYAVEAQALSRELGQTG